MEIIRNEDYIYTRRRIGLVASFIGIIILVGGMVVTFIGDPDIFTWALISLPAGWLVSQVGLFFSHRYVRKPRPDERIDEGLVKVAKKARIYHYILPVPHVLLTLAGPIVIIAKFQSGNIRADGDKWTQKGLGLRRFFGQENIGNPTLEAEYQIKRLAKYISRNIPEIADEEIPIGAVIVFTTKDGGELDLRGSNIPALHFSKLKGFWNQRKKDEPLPRRTYDALRNAFDAAAAEKGVLEEDFEEETS